MREAKSFVIDSSALLAVIYNEKLVIDAKKYFENSSMSVINATECIIVLNRNGMPIEIAKSLLESLISKFVICEFDNSNNITNIKNSNKNLGLSIADCFCLALGQKLELPIVTADKIWAEAKITSEVICIR
ncbi:putative PIN domain nuclease [Alphaproteobacteria bacterium]